ncbi:hypothetical protein QJS66_09075 [Kocuria rhizophila]|nr:hypothetical protein QJS66_09075 [Kocuria rhizophila]
MSELRLREAVSAEPAAKADKAEKAERLLPRRRARQGSGPARRGAGRPAAEATPVEAPAVAQAAPVAEATPVEVPAAPQAAPAAQTVTPVASRLRLRPRAADAAQPTRSRRCRPRPPLSRATPSTITVPPRADTAQTGYTARPATTAQTGYDTTANTGKVTTKSSTAPSRPRPRPAPRLRPGPGHPSAAEGQMASTRTAPPGEQRTGSGGHQPPRLARQLQVPAPRFRR